MKKCRKHGVGSRISNYISLILTKRPMCKIVQHFYLTEGHPVEDFTVTSIVGLVNPPKNSEKKSERLGNFEGYWQVKLITLELYGLNDRDEFFNPIQARLFLPFNGPRGSLGNPPYDLRNH